MVCGHEFSAYDGLEIRARREEWPEGQFTSTVVQKSTLTLHSLVNTVRHLLLTENEATVPLLLKRIINPEEKVFITEPNFTQMILSCTQVDLEAMLPVNPDNFSLEDFED